MIRKIIFIDFLYWRILLAAACLVMLASSVALAQGRSLTPDDLFRIEQIGEVAVSPDGQSVAFVRRRPRISAHVFQLPYISHNDRGDIWLAPLSGGVPTNLTKGEVDASGYWAPTWSPDGKRLAMLSTRGGDNVWLWTWEKATGRFTKVSERGIGFVVGNPGFAWIDNYRLAAVLLPKGEPPEIISMQRRTGWTAVKEWSKASKGQETTASVLDSGAGLDLKSDSDQQVSLVDVMGGEQPLMTIAKWQWTDPRNTFQIAPDKKHVAFLRQVARLQPNATKLLRLSDSRLGFAGTRHQLVIIDSNGRIVLTEVKSAKYVVPGSFEWSHDGHSFAFVGVRGGEENGPFRLFRGSVDGAIDSVTLPDCDPKAIRWIGERLLVSADCMGLTSGSANDRTDWWLVTTSSPPRNLTGRFKTAPSDLLPDPTEPAFVGVADNEVWRLNIDSGEWVNLTAAFAPAIAGIAWPNGTVSHDISSTCVIIYVSRGPLRDYYRVDLTSGATAPILRPSTSATMAAYGTKTDTAVFVAEESAGTYLTIVQGSESHRVIESNTFLRDIADGGRRMIDYRSLDGQDLKGWLLLPRNYVAGKLYPLVTWVYAGSLYADKEPDFIRLNDDNTLNHQLLAARGYAVLLPSMPLEPFPDGKSNLGTDPYMELTKGVLPAVDKLIELGIIDPRRLAVMGQSYGGYSVYGLVTQTNRFQTAVSLAGPSDLVSFYGTLNAQTRYEFDAHENHFQHSVAESGQIRMGGPPWKDWGRYLRNSPIFYVDRVQTPLMIIQGDMDIVAIQQGEEFFTSLFRQGKRARLIRYWGEGHVFESPANIRDAWVQIYSWLDEFCDISRDEKGDLVFNGDHVKSRNGAPALKPEDFERFMK